MAYTPHDWNEMFTYDDVNGYLIWKMRPLKFFHDSRGMHIANTSRFGKVAGKSKPFKPIQICIGTKHFLAHRIIWEMHNGAIPHGMMIDHIDGDPSNNRLSNLRLATNAENCRNRGAISKRSGMFKGVHWIAEKKKWAAFIRVDGKTHFICYSHDPEIAARRYDIAAILNHREFARLNFP